jgi:hypothetical protein
MATGELRLSRNAVQSINNDTSTAVSWDTEIFDDLGAWSSGATITVPTGVTEAKVTIHTSWANNGTGVRYAYLEYPSGTTVRVVEQEARNESGQGFVTSWLTVVAGQTMQVMVRQNSGGSLNLSGSAVFGGPSYIEVLWR